MTPKFCPLPSQTQIANDDALPDRPTPVIILLKIRPFSRVKTIP